MKKLLISFLCLAISLIGYSQDENMIIEGGTLILKANENIPNPVAGTIRWTGADFEGYNGTEWLSLTGRSIESNPIEIGSYVFNFPSGFTLVPAQGIDSYVGNIEGAGISLSFDYGWYTSPVSNLPEDEYEVVEDELNGHFRQIVKPVDSELNITRIHLYKISDQIGSPFGYNSLTITVKSISLDEQAMIIEVFNGVEISE